MRKIYLYPKSGRGGSESFNPFIRNLESSISGDLEVVNKKRSNIGILDMFQYLFRADAFFFNWIETLPLKKTGKLQTILFFGFLFFARLLGKKIIWILHNKYVHTKTGKRGNNWWTRKVFVVMIRKSDKIFTLSNEGVYFLEHEFPGFESKASYFIHPILKPFDNNKLEHWTYDFLIWGTIQPYKGIVDFLKFISESEEMSNKRILICGRCSDLDYKMKIQALSKGNVEYRDEFMSLEEISILASKSKCILFTYNTDSVLSSGSLMDSIRMGSLVIGPDKGAFRDLKGNGFIRTYFHFKDLIALSSMRLDDSKLRREELLKFCKENNWATFGGRISSSINKLFE